MIRTFFLFCLTLSLAVSIAAEQRTWTDLHGRQIEAELQEVAGNEVTIERADGHRFTVSSTTFSDRDQAYIREWVSRNQASEEVFQPGKWPARIQIRAPSVEIVEETKETNIYRTEHFEFRSDTRLSRTLVAQFGQIFEATFAAVQALPIGLDVSAPEKGYFVTRLFSSASDYHQAGGIPGSGGIYNPAAREILVPIENLGVKRSSSGYSFDRYRDNSTLIHEITHQVMHPWLQHLPVWLMEGLAVYMETIPYQRGDFQFRQQDLKDYLERTTGGRNTPLPIVPLEILMSLSYRDWSGDFAQNTTTVPRNYYTALLLTYYLLHLDGEKDSSRLVEYLQARLAGTAAEESTAILFAGRSASEVQEEMLVAFNRIGIGLQAP